MLNAKLLLATPVLLSILMLSVPACVATDDEDAENEGGTPGTGGFIGHAGESSGGSTEPGESGGSAGEPSPSSAGETGLVGGTGGTGGSGGNGGPTSGGTAAGGVAADAGSGGAGESDAGAGPGTEGGGTGLSDKWGVVALDQTGQYIQGFGTIEGAGAVAVFGLRLNSENACEETELGACLLFTNCPTGSDGEATVGLDAGQVTITGFDDEVSLEHLDTGTPSISYMSEVFTSYLWTSSKAVSVKVEGSAEVPGYEMELELPDVIEVTAPLPDSDHTYAISKGGDLNVTWNDGGVGMVTVSLSSGTAEAGDAVGITCVVEASEGELSIPKEFMAELGDTGGFAAGVSSVAVKNVEDWTMQFQATTLRDALPATFIE